MAGNLSCWSQGTAKAHALLSAPVQWAGQSLSTGMSRSTVPAIIIYNSVEIITGLCRAGEKLSVSLGAI